MMGMNELVQLLYGNLLFVQEATMWEGVLPTEHGMNTETTVAEMHSETG